MEESESDYNFKIREENFSKESLQLFLNCVYLVSFCFVFPNYNTTFPLLIANKKINKEQIWTAVILSNKQKAFSQGYKLFQNKKNVLYTLCWMISYFYNHAITYICNKDIFILYLWSMWWRVFQKFLVLSFTSEKKLCFKIREINKQTQTKWFLFLKKNYLNR